MHLQDYSLLWERTLPFPKHKNQILSANNISKWYRYKKTEYKNKYKSFLKDMIIPENNGEPYTELLVVYKVLRHNNRRVDAMNIVMFLDKWFVDALVDEKWLTDDDKVSTFIEQTEFSCGGNETKVLVKICKKEE